MSFLSHGKFHAKVAIEILAKDFNLYTKISQQSNNPKPLAVQG
jgi:hypothetical protein